MARGLFTVGALVGLLTVGGALATTGRVASTPAPGATVRLVTAPTGELHVEAAGPLVVDDLRPGGTATAGAVTVFNQTARAVQLEVDVPTDGSDLGDSLVVDLVGDVDEPLPSGASRTFDVTAGLRAGSRGTEGALAEVPLSITAVTIDG